MMQAMNRTKKKKSTKRKQTREKILEGAIHVFSNYPYCTASIRMIGKAAGIDHPLVNYYFPTKSMLFEEVIKQVTDEYFQANISWINGLEQLDPETAVDLYIDRFFDFAAKHQSALRIVALNMVQPEGHDDIPGYEQVRNFFAETKQTFINAIPMHGTADEIETFTNVFNTLAINYLGAGNYHASILGLQPGSPEYLKWVKETVMLVTLPQLRKLIHGNKQK